MNIGRAKTILIYAFLGLNLFLCYQLFGGGFKELARARVAGKQWRYVEEQLSESGYIVEARVDHSTRKGSFLTVSPSGAPERIIRERFDLPSTPAIDPEGVLLYQGKGAGLRVSPGGAIRLELTPGLPLPEEIAAADEKMIASLIEQHLRENRLVTTGIAYDHMTRAGKKTILHYVQTCGEMFLFSGYLKVLMENNIIVGLDMYLLEPETSPGDREMEVISAARALGRLIEILESDLPSRRIVKADLGFYSCEYDAEKWEVPPVWRFLFDNGENCFINAFTGNLEPETSN